MELTRKTIPEMIPIQCSRPSEELTTEPAMCRVGSTEKTVGASTNAKKISPPSQTIRDISMRKRRNDMGLHYRNREFDRQFTKICGTPLKSEMALLTSFHFSLPCHSEPSAAGGQDARATEDV